MKKASLLSFIIFISITLFASDKGVNTGADILLGKDYSMIRGKNIGIVTNHSAILSGGIHLVDTLISRKDVRIVALFGPEHGIRGDAPDGIKINDSVDVKTGIPVHSLYGKISKPTPEMLRGVEVMLFDIQDIGARFYTFISTLYYTIEACAENNIPLIVLDRPNPIGGLKVYGPVSTEELKSFVAIAPMPIMHGMTIGELALFFNQERIRGKKADISVIRMENWQRGHYFDDCGLKFLKPSPNIPDVETEIVYPGTCLFEGTNISEGRGTQKPFLTFGAPWLEPAKVIECLQEQGMEGLSLRPVEFIPVEIPNMASNPKYRGEKCQGIEITVCDRLKFNAVEFGVKAICAIQQVHGDKLSFPNNRIDKLFGDNYFQGMVKKGDQAEKIIERWQRDLSKFRQIRQKYLLY